MAQGHQQQKLRKNEKSENITNNMGWKTNKTKQIFKNTAT